MYRNIKAYKSPAVNSDRQSDERNDRQTSLFRHQPCMLQIEQGHFFSTRIVIPETGILQPGDPRKMKPNILLGRGFNLALGRILAFLSKRFRENWPHLAPPKP